MDISPDDVKKIAHLARLRLTDDEAELYRGQLRAILDSMEEISEVAADNIEPTSNVLGLNNVLRDDEPVESPYRGKILELAPARESSLFKVKKVIE